MWENDKKSTIIRNILIFILLVCVVAGLFYAYRRVQARIAAEDRELSMASNNQRRELIDNRQENLDAVQQAYAVDMQTVADYMPGIVCWGDSLTAGSSGNVSYPYTLQKYLNAYLCDIYDFRSGMANAENFSRVKWDDYKVSIPVVNMGAGQENSATILGRSGAAPYVVQTDFTIPAAVSPADITFTAPDGKTVAPLTAGGVGINPVTIAGVQGTLTANMQNSYAQQVTYQFTRLEAGDAVKVPAGTKIYTAAAQAYTDYIHIVWLGTYDPYRAPMDLVNDVKLLLSRQTQNTDRYLVLGPCTYNGTWGSGTGYDLDAIDTAMVQAFGNRYVNVRKYLIEDGIREAGAVIDNEDRIRINNGQVPSAFRSNASGADLNSVAYPLIGRLVYQRMDQLGYFSEIREELNLNKTVQDILKKDPAYFDRILSVK